MAKPDISDSELIKLAKERGFSLKKKVTYLKKTFEIERDTLDEFMRVQEKAGVLVKYAVNEALKDWSKKNG